jgi:two-component sensor histidine kinase
MAANLLNSERAIEVSVYVMRAFVRLRETLIQHEELAARLDELEKRVQAMSVNHDRLAVATRLQLQEVFDAIRALMIPLEPAKKRSIGFITDEPKRSRGAKRSPD